MKRVLGYLRIKMRSSSKPYLYLETVNEGGGHDRYNSDIGGNIGTKIIHNRKNIYRKNTNLTQTLMHTKLKLTPDSVEERQVTSFPGQSANFRSRPFGFFLKFKFFPAEVWIGHEIPLVI